MMADRKIEIDWKSRSGSIGVWNVEDKLSSWNSTTRVESRQTGWRNLVGLRLWKQSRTWSEAESREQNLEVLKSSWTGRFWKLDIE